MGALGNANKPLQGPGVFCMRQAMPLLQSRLALQVNPPGFVESAPNNCSSSKVSSLSPGKRDHSSTDVRTRKRFLKLLLHARIPRSPIETLQAALYSSVPSLGHPIYSLLLLALTLQRGRDGMGPLASLQDRHSGVCL